jgi:hypothetical protein
MPGGKIAVRVVASPKVTLSEAVSPKVTVAPSWKSAPVSVTD